MAAWEREGLMSPGTVVAMAIQAALLLGFWIVSRRWLKACEQLRDQTAEQARLARQGAVDAMHFADRVRGPRLVGKERVSP